MIIRRIEPKRNTQKKRVAAYCRVSTDKAEQLESFETQTTTYSEMITRNPDWTFVDVYADEGLSGTNAKRSEFQRMIADAMAGKMDMILVKSISRFSRNTEDCQRYARELKSRNVEVFFEREGLSTLDPSTDMIFSLLGAVAQDESRSISENVKWTYQQNFEKGKYRVGSHCPLGFALNAEGELTPNGDAWIVRQVFNAFCDGMPLQIIADQLNCSGAKRMRSEKPFDCAAIHAMLRNELYVGDRTLQKRPPTNYLTKRPDKHEPYTSHYLENTHEGIIDRETWERAKALLDKRRSEMTKGVHHNSNGHFLYGKLFCGDCGAPYKRRSLTNRDGTSYKAWNCKERQKGRSGNGCKNIVLKEDALLADISAQLGWEWVDADRFDTSLFLHAVDRIQISADGIAVCKPMAV